VAEARPEQLQAGRRPQEASSAGARRRSCTGGRRRSTPTRVRGTTAAEVGSGHQCGERSHSMRLGSLLLVVWLVIGGVAAAQHGYFKSSDSR